MWFWRGGCKEQKIFAKIRKGTKIGKPAQEYFIPLLLVEVGEKEKLPKFYISTCKGLC